MYVVKAAKTTFVRKTRWYNVDEIDGRYQELLTLLHLPKNEHSNSVITNTSGPAKFVRYNRVAVLAKHSLIKKIYKK